MGDKVILATSVSIRLVTVEQASDSQIVVWGTEYDRNGRDAREFPDHPRDNHLEPVSEILLQRIFAKEGMVAFQKKLVKKLQDAPWSALPLDTLLNFDSLLTKATGEYALQEQEAVDSQVQQGGKPNRNVFYWRRIFSRWVE